jgi:hypothetical protein
MRTENGDEGRIPRDCVKEWNPACIKIVSLIAADFLFVMFSPLHTRPT